MIAASAIGREQIAVVTIAERSHRRPDATTQADAGTVKTWQLISLF